ncbi:MAG: TonB-dependent receptor [Ignavibacteriaceae bacterium]
MKIKLLSVLMVTFIYFGNYAQVNESNRNGAGKVYGKIIDEEGKPLAFVNVYLLNSLEGTMSDENGNFSFFTKNKGKAELVASLIGYKKYQEIINLSLPHDSILIVLSASAITTKEVIVTASSFSSEKEKGVVLTSMDVITTPGGAADIFQSLKTLPGLTQVSESAELYVRGGDPIETLVMLDQATINHPYTFESAYGGIFSNINTNSIKGLYFSSGGFSAKYGNALSGVLELSTKNIPELKEISLGISMASAELNGAIPFSNNFAVRFNGRQSFTQPIFWLNGEARDFTLMPVSKDLNSSFIYKYSNTGRIKFYSYFAEDKEGVNVAMPGYIESFNGTSGSSFYNFQVSDIIFEKVITKTSISYNEFKNKWLLGILDYKRTDKNYKLRSDYEYTLTKGIKLSAGFEIEKRNAAFLGVIPAEDYNLKSNAPSELLNAGFNVTRNGGYLEFEFKNLFNTDGLFLIAGGREDIIKPFNLNWFDPRINLGYKLDDKSTLNLAFGVFHQHPDPRLYSPSDGNPNLKPMEAKHYILSYDYKLSNNTNLRIESYYKDYKYLPLEDKVLNYNNNGYGFAEGMDILLKGNFLKSISGWISYGFINTKRKWMDYNNFCSSDYNITHNLSLVLKYNLNQSIQLGLTYKYASGKPFTPVIGANFNSYQNIYEPVYGNTNSERLPSYQRLDLRITYLTQLFSNYFSVFYIEGLNILNINNIFDYSYNFNYTDKMKVTSYFGRRIFVMGMIFNL